MSIWNREGLHQYLKHKAVLTTPIVLRFNCTIHRRSRMRFSARLLVAAADMTGSNVAHLPVLVDGNAFSHRWFHRWAHTIKLFGEKSSRPNAFAQNNARSLMALTQSLRIEAIASLEMPENAGSYALLASWPNKVVVFFDYGDGGRTEMFPDYKKERRLRPRPAELETFFEEAKAVYRGQPNNSCLIVPELHQHGLDSLNAEADDMIATTSVALTAKGVPHVVCTHDIDLMHLVSDANRVVLYDPRTKQLMNEAKVLARVGVLPRYLVDYKSLAGDKSDGIPGVASIGPKRAAALLAEYISLEGVLTRGAVEAKGKKIRQALASSRAAAELSKRLVLHKHAEEILPTVMPFLLGGGRPTS